MARLRGAYDLAAQCGGDGLVAEADAENGDFAAELADDFDGAAGFRRRAGARGQHDCFGAEATDLARGGRVVADDVRLLAEPLEIAG
jgi:hypothetical protein